MEEQIVEGHEHRRAALNRMARIIGHMNAVKTMLTEERDCSDILIQLSAIRSELSGLGKVILKDHLSHCIVEAVESGDEEAIRRLNSAIDRML